ncbi:MAG TPA: dihydrodipicolinate synthase family protein [Burkholderiales bacterium]|nr:dihydrodipicolinate synthase family protein [Burkholderiales bacterium]
MNYRKSEAKEASRAQFRGLWAAIPTPFTADLRVDEEGLRHNMRRLTSGLKIEGVFCTGVMGEFWSLTKEERKRVVEIVVEEARRGGCKVIAHTAHHSAHETVELTRHAQQVGADFVILINQYYPPASEQTMYEWFKFVAERVDIGIWMFDAEYSGWGMSPELTARIAEIENVCGIKIPRPLEHYARVHKLCGERIVMSHPSETDWLRLMKDFGQRVHQSSPAPYLFQTPSWLPMREYTELGLAGRFEEAEKIAQRLEPLRQVYDKWMRGPWVRSRLVPIAYLKAWCELLGMAGGPVRPGLPQISDQERRELRADLERTGILARVPAAKAA